MIVNHQQELVMRTSQQTERATARRAPAIDVGCEPSTWTALIVEDDPDNLDLIWRVLTFNRAIVHVAHNGSQSLEILSRLKPTFVLMDLSMPHMDGWTTLKQIRATAECASVPVIAVTAHAMKGDRERVLAFGFDGYISKPFQVTTLVDQIRYCIMQVSLNRTVRRVTGN